METVLFWILAVGAVGSALLVILPPLARNPLYSSLALLATFVFIAGIYVMLVAHLVAVLQILVYAGAVMVLFIFVIMLLNLRDHELKPARITPARVIGSFAGIFVLVKLAYVLIVSTATGGGADLTNPVGVTPTGDAVYYGTIKHVGRSLFTDYLLPFELVSILLLVAVIGSVVLAKQHLDPPVTTEADG